MPILNNGVEAFDAVWVELNRWESLNLSLSIFH